MDHTTAGKQHERTERDGDRGPAPREVEAHMTPPTSAPGDAEGDADSGPETQGHMLGEHPYLMESTAADRRRDALRAADQDRRAAEAGGQRGIVERVVDRVRGRGNG